MPSRRGPGSYRHKELETLTLTLPMDSGASDDLRYPYSDRDGAVDEELNIPSPRLPSDSDHDADGAEDNS